MRDKRQFQAFHQTIEKEPMGKLVGENQRRLNLSETKTALTFNNQHSTFTVSLKPGIVPKFAYQGYVSFR